MNKIALSLAALIAFVFACCSQDTDNLFPICKLNSGNDDNPVLEYIRLASNPTRGRADFQITPFIYEGDTVMFVAQDDNGWELYSGDSRYPLHVMKCPEGNFDIDLIQQPLKDEILEIAAYIHNIKETNALLPDDESWSWLHPDFEEEDDILALANDEIPDYGNGKWVLIEIVDKGTEVEDMPHLCQTIWGQGTPWNACIPFDLSMSDRNHSLVGCVPVAVAQYAYFLHFKDGVPANAPSACTYNSALNWYTFSGFNSISWNQMAKHRNESGTGIAAAFLGYVASKIVNKNDFSYETTTSYLKDAIAKYLQTATNKQYEFLNYADNLKGRLVTEIKSGYPVLARGSLSITDDGQIQEIGHAFIIDSYRKETIKTEYVYGWDGKTVSGRDPNTYNLDGTVAVYGIQKRDFQTSTKEYFRMNWGRDGAGNNVLYSISNWIYNNQKAIVLRK